MNKKEFLETVGGLIMIILMSLAVLIFIGMFIFLPIAGGDTPSIFDLVTNFFK